MIKKTYLYVFLVLHSVILSHPTPAMRDTSYVPIGVGGGGAMSGVSISPYNNIWFVGTDMGTLFRSSDSGKSWRAVNHLQTTFGSNLSHAVSPGFSSDGKTIFHAVHGENPQRSTDAGETFSSIPLSLQAGEYIKYWLGDSKNPDIIYCATSKGLLKTEDKGDSWIRIKGISYDSRGTFIDQLSPKKTIYHATQYRIWASEDGGKTFKSFHLPYKALIRNFTGGSDRSGLTLAYSDDSGLAACSWVRDFRLDFPAARIRETTDNCGFLWVSTNGKFTKTNQAVGDHLKMAENDASAIYVTGGKKWIRQYGTKIHVSKDKGQTWILKLHQLNWDVVPYEPWPASRIEYSAIALDVGWWDDGYEGFDVNRLNSSISIGSGYFFVHSSTNYGDTWQAPFTKYSDRSEMSSQREWQTRGIEVISIYKAKFHPANSNLLYAASADIGGMVSENGGKTFRLSKADYNSNYDYSFDVKNDSVVFTASGNTHDFPNSWYANYLKSAGGIYRSDDRGLNWKRLTPDNTEFNRQFLSVAYDSSRKYIYGGTQEKGIVISKDDGKTWTYFNDGLPASQKIIPQIEVNPKNGNVYALLTGNAPDFTNQAQTGIYFLDVAKGSTKWVNLRGTLTQPEGVKSKLWFYPTAFALNFNQKSEPLTLWLTDYENKDNWLATGVWKSTDGGKSWSRVHQMTHPTGITLDAKNPKHVHVAGYYTLNGSWGNGGQYYSKDEGKTWKKNANPPLQQNSRNVVINPSDSDELIYTYFGGGMLKGPNPAQ